MGSLQDGSNSSISFRLLIGTHTKLQISFQWGVLAGVNLILYTHLFWDCVESSIWDCQVANTMYTCNLLLRSCFTITPSLLKYSTNFRLGTLGDDLTAALVSVKMKKVPIRSMFPTGPVKNGLYIRIKKFSLQSKSNQAYIIFFT
jgi:hypothetical protein